jgi:hypothetical protein
VAPELVLSDDTTADALTASVQVVLDAWKRTVAFNG